MHTYIYIYICIHTLKSAYLSGFSHDLLTCRKAPRNSRTRAASSPPPCAAQQQCVAASKALESSERTWQPPASAPAPRGVSTGTARELVGDVALNAGSTTRHHCFQSSGNQAWHPNVAAVTARAVTGPRPRGIHKPGCWQGEVADTLSDET